ncbi:unnamed protein product [Mytilus edulis]|uniref:Uncharacterized protein n=1 Tax=Mytilus edulis TaxID=6550 RepID=A0A8S3UC19_MYTED|nr:unnamed protein product [Mytilus edulis]
MAGIKLQLLLLTKIILATTNNEETYPQLLFSGVTTLGVLDTRTGNISILADGYNYILFLDYHIPESYIFWSDYTGGTISRLKYPSEVNTVPEIIITTDYPRVSTLDGSNTAVVANINGPLDLELDISNGRLYYVSNFIEISTCRLDGSDCRVLLDSSIVISGVENIAIDLEENRIFGLLMTSICQYNHASLMEQLFRRLVRT